MANVLTEPFVMADKKRNDETVKIEREIVARARVVVESRKLTGRPVSLAQYLSELLRSPVDRDFAKALKEMGDV